MHYMNEIEFLIAGIIFGLSAAFSPGPLMTIMLSETLTKGRAAGIKIAIAPLITDVPILLIALFILTKISNVNEIIGILSLVGSVFLAYLGIDSIRMKKITISIQKTNSGSIKKGILTNFLNPHPYLFFFSVGGPLIIQGLKVSIFAPILFLIGFFGCLIGTNIALLIVASKSRSFLTSKTYVYINKILGIVLILFALSFLQKGMILLGMKYDF